MWTHKLVSLTAGAGLHCWTTSDCVKEKIATSASADSQTTPCLAPHWFKPAGTRAAFTCSGVFCKHTIVFTEASSDFTYIDFERTQLPNGFFFVFIEAFRKTWAFFTYFVHNNTIRQWNVKKKSVNSQHQIWESLSCWLWEFNSSVNLKPSGLLMQRLSINNVSWQKDPSIVVPPHNKCNINLTCSCCTTMSPAANRRTAVKPISQSEMSEAGVVNIYMRGLCAWKPSAVFCLWQSSPRLPSSSSSSSGQNKEMCTAQAQEVIQDTILWNQAAQNHSQLCCSSVFTPVRNQTPQLRCSQSVFTQFQEFSDGCSAVFKEILKEVFSAKQKQKLNK